MIYELWDIIEITEGESLSPFSKLHESNNFLEIYELFLKYTFDKINPIKCVIVINTPPIPGEYKTSAKIYESPDGGNTIFERTILQNKRVKIK